MNIAGIDPGKKTGMVLLIVEDDNIRIFDATEATNMAEVLEYLDAWQPDAIVMEAFRLYPWTAQALGWDPMLPSQIIGAVKAWAAMREPPVEIVEQPASIRKLAQTHTKRLEKIALFRGKPHARDALRHAMWYAIHRWPRKALNVRW